MARKTFFSFHYADDSWRAAIVRNSWVTQDRQAAGFFDSADWEQVKRQQDSAIERWIDNQLNGTSVTVVLIGANTYGRKWINYEITSSWAKNNGLLGIYINQLKDQYGRTTSRGWNPFSQWEFKDDKGIIRTFPVYDWVNDNGYQNMGNWIEQAAQAICR